MVSARKLQRMFADPRGVDLEGGSLDSPDWVIVSTAHPAKFESIVEPLIGRTVDIPMALAELLHRECSFVEIEPTLEALLGVVR